jgi:hypothetical protein
MVVTVSDFCFCHSHNVDSIELKIQTWVYPYWHNIHSKCHTSPFTWVKGNTTSLIVPLPCIFFINWRSGQWTKHLNNFMVLLGLTHTLTYETVNIFLLRSLCYKLCMNICFSWFTQQGPNAILYNMLLTSWWIASKQVQRYICCQQVPMFFSCFLPCCSHNHTEVHICT